MTVDILPVLIVVACKLLIAANSDPNAAFTHVDTEWATENSMMVCKRHEVDLYDPVEGIKNSSHPTTQPLPST